MINRRSLITGLVSFAAAPAIVKIYNIMPVKVMVESQSGVSILQQYVNLLPIYTEIDFGVLNMAAFYISHTQGGRVKLESISPAEFYKMSNFMGE